MAQKYIFCRIRNATRNKGEQYTCTVPHFPLYAIRNPAGSELAKYSFEINKLEIVF